MAWVADNSCNDLIICCKLWVKCFNLQKLECITQCVMHPITRCNLPEMQYWCPYYVGETRIYWSYIVLQIWYPYRAFEHRSWSHTLCDRFSWYLHTMLKTLEFSSLRLVQKKTLFDSLVAYSCSSLISLKEVCAVPLTILLISILLHSHSVSSLTIVFTLGSASKHAQSIIYSVLPKKRSW